MCRVQKALVLWVFLAFFAACKQAGDEKATSQKAEVAKTSKPQSQASNGQKKLAPGVFQLPLVFVSSLVIPNFKVSKAAQSSNEYLEVQFTLPPNAQYARLWVCQDGNPCTTRRIYIGSNIDDFVYLESGDYKIQPVACRYDYTQDNPQEECEPYSSDMAKSFYQPDYKNEAAATILQNVNNFENNISENTLKVKNSTNLLAMKINQCVQSPSDQSKLDQDKIKQMQTFLDTSVSSYYELIKQATMNLKEQPPGLVDQGQASGQGYGLLDATQTKTQTSPSTGSKTVSALIGGASLTAAWWGAFFWVSMGSRSGSADGWILLIGTVVAFTVGAVLGANSASLADNPNPACAAITDIKTTVTTGSDQLNSAISDFRSYLCNNKLLPKTSCN